MIIYISLLNIITLKKIKTNKKEHYCMRKACIAHAMSLVLLILIFNILRTKIPLHKFLNSLKYPYFIVKQF